MATLDLDREWQQILDACPDDLSGLAKATGAVQRWRHVRSGADLLRLALSYSVGDLSLRTAAGCMTAQDVPLADTSALDRLRAAPPFLGAVLAHLLDPGGPAAAPPGLRIRDATIVSVPGSTGIDWRLHAGFDPCTARLCAVDVTDHTGGERLSRDAFAPGDVVLGDRGLGTVRGLHAVAAAGAACLLRVHLDNLGAHVTAARALTPADLARRARRGDHETAIVVADPDGGPPVRARLLVAPLARAAAAAARRRCRREAAKAGRVPHARTLALAGLVVLITTVPRTVLTARQALALYRVRYQVELFFKRAKSLLDLDALRADDPALVRAYLLAKLIAIALVERRVGALQGVSPLRHAA